MKIRRLAFFAVGLFIVSPSAHAKETTGDLSIHYTLGPSFLVGGSDAKDAGQSVEPGVDAALELGLIQFLSFQFGYDHFSNLQSQDIMFAGVFKPMPEMTNSPFITVGMGWGQRLPGDNWNKFAMKIEGGFEHFFTDELSGSALIGYHYINGPDPLGSVHVIEPGIRFAYHFGDLRRFFH